MKIENKIIREEIKIKKRSNLIWKVVIIAMLVSSLFGAIFGFLAGKLSDSLIIKNNEVILEKESAVVDVVDKNSPAVVSIVVSKDVPKFRNSFNNPNRFDFFFSPFNYDQENMETEKQKIGGGTGFFVTADGLIVTNKHVVVDEDAKYTVITKDEKEYETTVLARHPTLDIAVLDIESEENFPVLALGDSDNLKVGQSVIAIGNSLGEFSNSVSLGIISGLQRNIVASSDFGQTEKLNDIIQTDAAINPGNSGGPLLDISGEVIGVNVAVVSGAQSVGFALPINQVKKIIEQIKENGELSTPFLGVRYILLNEEISKDNNLSYDYGALVIRGEKITDFAVIPSSPADKAGIIENDVILEIEGEKITEDNLLADVISRFEVRDEIILKLWHKGKEKNTKVILEKMK